MTRKQKYAIIGIVPRPNLWPLIQKEKWYHIPVESAPSLTPVIRYIGFYFPKVFDSEYRYKIIYYAEVLNIDVVKRIELFPNEPNHSKAKDDYYKLCFNEIKELSDIIENKTERLIIHIPSTFKKLISAKEINDLWHTSFLEEKLYKDMKNRGIKSERQVYVNVGDEKYYLDFEVTCNCGKIDIECDGEKYHNFPASIARDKRRNNQLVSYGWSVLRFSGNEINKHINDCLDIIETTIYTLGGLKD